MKKNISIFLLHLIMLTFLSCPGLMKNTYTVSFESNSGTQVSSQTIEEGGLVSKPENPSRTGYSFMNWYSNPNLTTIWDFDSDTVSSDITLYAGWVISGIKNVSAGPSFSMFIRSDDTLWGMGANSRGQLGDGTENYSLIPIQIMTDVQFVETGDEHTMILKNDGTLWGTGFNEHGELGDGTQVNKSSPVHIMSDVASVSAGESHTMILKTDGTLWGTGANAWGQLGDGTGEDKYTPVQIMSEVKSVSAGSRHTLIIKTDGTLWGTGANSHSELGGTGDLWDNYDSPVQTMDNVESVSTGIFYSLILKTDGTLLGVGNNSYGQLGDGTESERHGYEDPIEMATNVRVISAAYNHTMYLKNDNTLWASGNNSYGELGDGSTNRILTHIQVMSDVQFVSIGRFHTLVIKVDDTMWGSGYNWMGNLGDGTQEDKHGFIEIK